MIRNLYTVAWRRILKNKLFSFLNILGLAIGLATCFFIFQYIHFERSYEQYNKNAENVYRIPLEFYESNGIDNFEATNHPAAGPAMKANFPEVVAFARLIPTKVMLGTSAISRIDNGVAGVAFNEKRIFLADAAVFKIFPIRFIYGNDSTALKQMRSIVLSESKAKKYFGTKNPVGESMYLNAGFPLTVTGVFKDIPENSHLKFDMLISFPDEKYHADNWGWPEFYTYLMLAPGTDPQKLEAKFPAFVNRYLGAEMKQSNFRYRFHLQPIKDIHLGSHYQNELEVNGNKTDIIFLSIISILVLLVACINYINLSTAKAIERVREVGLRKVLGASRSQLIWQFLVESILVNCLALFWAAVIVWILTPFYADFIGKSATENFWTSGLLSEASFWIALFLILIGESLLIGIYPAFITAKFNPIYGLKGKFYGSLKGIFVRKVLVGFQFALVILLIAGSLIVFNQLTYMRRQALGYNKDEVLVIKTPGLYNVEDEAKINLLPGKLSGTSTINDVSLSSEIPGEVVPAKKEARIFGEARSRNTEVAITQIDDHFLKSYQIKLVAGRDFRQQDSVDLFPINGVTFPGIVPVIVNESSAKNLGFKTGGDAVNKFITFRVGSNDLKGGIIGVVKNYHQRSLKDPYEPMLYIFPTRTEWRYYSVNLATKNLEQNISSIQSIYKNLFPASPFEFFFLDDYFNEQYKSDRQFAKVFNVFTGLTIFISFIGLLGLLSFSIRTRLKEVAVRRVLGATAYNIINLFFSDFFKLIGLAGLVSLPLVYFAGTSWLNNFAFHAPLNILVFIIPPVFLLTITFAAVTAQSITVALSSPVTYMREE